MGKGRAAARVGNAGHQPGWADGLRKLYDGVVNEPLPDSFDELLRKLDQADDD
ncbi:MAG: hypothetical protein JSR28_08925 [Proteobacteria bacterium]|nr:hypothetical protein [Pseudomonadota bacterium]MDE2411022.1 hypothetical protein [Sphingomonadales bacterium]